MEFTLDLFNEAIVNSTALYDDGPRPRESTEGWFNTGRPMASLSSGLSDTRASPVDG